MCERISAVLFFVCIHGCMCDTSVLGYQYISHCMFICTYACVSYGLNFIVGVLKCKEFYFCDLIYLHLFHFTLVLKSRKIKISAGKWLTESTVCVVYLLKRATMLYLLLLLSLRSILT